MNVGCVSNLFGSAVKSKLLKDADKVCRIISKEFPAISGTRIPAFKCAEADNRFINYYNYKIHQNRCIRDDAWKFYDSEETMEFYKRFLQNMKKYKNINCADYTKLAQLVLKANNVDAVNATIMTHGLKSLDHAVLIVKPHLEKYTIFYKNKDLKNLIIIDPWLGFADYGHNAVVRYNSEFSRYLGLGEKYEQLGFVTRPNPEISPKTLEYIRETFPQFIQKKGFMTIA